MTIRWVAAMACAVAAVAGAGCGGDSDSDDGTPTPVPAFYMTARSATDLRHQAYDAAARFAKEQGPGSALLMLDFGAARRRNDTWGVSLRSGPFHSNEDVRDALEAAADGYHDHYQRGDVTIVYLNSNANLGDPGRGYTKFDKDTAHEAGEQQAAAIRNLKLPSNVSAAVGGDIEPGYDFVASPEVSVEMVAGAVEASGGPYYDVGTAPCRGDVCIRGWTPKDLCEVASGQGRNALPEIYFAIQAEGWADVTEKCGIKTFAGAGASPIGDLSARESWRRLREATGAEVDDAVVVFPG